VWELVHSLNDHVALGANGRLHLSESVAKIWELSFWWVEGAKGFPAWTTSCIDSWCDRSVLSMLTLSSQYPVILCGRGFLMLGRGKGMLGVMVALSLKLISCRRGPDVGEVYGFTHRRRVADLYMWLPSWLDERQTRQRPGTQDFAPVFLDDLRRRGSSLTAYSKYENLPAQQPAPSYTSNTSTRSGRSLSGVFLPVILSAQPFCTRIR
jgi:hypothetical protein